jgi:hypothetical protein
VICVRSSVGLAPAGPLDGSWRQPSSAAAAMPSRRTAKPSAASQEGRPHAISSCSRSHCRRLHSTLEEGRSWLGAARTTLPDDAQLVSASRRQGLGADPGSVACPRRPDPLSALIRFCFYLGALPSLSPAGGRFRREVSHADQGTWSHPDGMLEAPTPPYAQFSLPLGLPPRFLPMPNPRSLPMGGATGSPRHRAL